MARHTTPAERVSAPAAAIEAAEQAWLAILRLEHPDLHWKLVGPAPLDDSMGGRG